MQRGEVLREESQASSPRRLRGLPKREQERKEWLAQEVLVMAHRAMVGATRVQVKLGPAWLALDLISLHTKYVESEYACWMKPGCSVVQSFRIGVQS
jgi:hypothetical protein